MLKTLKQSKRLKFTSLKQNILYLTKYLYQLQVLILVRKYENILIYCYNLKPASINAELNTSTCFSIICLSSLKTLAFSFASCFFMKTSFHAFKMIGLTIRYVNIDTTLQALFHLNNQNKYYFEDLIFTNIFISHLYSILCHPNTSIWQTLVLLGLA